MDITPNGIIRILDLIGIASFAFSGALRAIHRRLDLVGITILAGATAIGGGLIRDALIGGRAGMLRDWRYPAVILASALVSIVFPRKLAEKETFFRYFDAMGLGIFSAIGATIALQSGLGFLWAMSVACISGAGGGVVRDVLLGEVPLVLYREIYITAVIFGAAALWIARRFLGAGELTGFFLGMTITIVIRVVAIWRAWSLPRVNLTARDDTLDRTLFGEWVFDEDED
ncbi:MAG: trimeric intracellular cation channel family protein [bacterium]|jgi:uncharacterized membrane protein YeiH